MPLDGNKNSLHNDLQFIQICFIPLQKNNLK